MPAKVFFVEAKNVNPRTIEALFETLGMGERIPKASSVAVKLHFGEVDNYTHVRPGLVKKWVDLLKDRGARPFLTDTNTLYRHRRADMFSHLETAAAHGFTPESMGCPIIIADGLRNWVRTINLDSPYRLSEIGVALGIADADSLITITHLTLHHVIGIGGAVKNLAMGCVGRSTKLHCHALEGASVRFIQDRCIVCGTCVRICPGEAYEIVDGKVVYTPEKCVACGDCIHHCPALALTPRWDTPREEVHKGLLDSARGVLKAMEGKPLFHFTVAMDITRLCDCCATSERFVPDIGILGSTDPVALDKACQDLLAKSPPMPGEKGVEGEDKLRALYPDIDMDAYWRLCTDAGIGTTDYELEEIKPPKRH